MRIHVKAKTWEFLPSNDKEPTVLWKDGRTIKDNRRKLVHNYFTIYNLTQFDNGQYSLKDRNGIVLSTTHLDVKGELTV